MLRNKNTIFILLLSALLCLAFYDVVFLNRTFKVSSSISQALPYGVYGQQDNKPEYLPLPQVDSAVLEEPLLEFIKQNLQAGILPLWNPHQGLGVPLIAMIEVGIFYPLHLIIYCLPSILSWDILILTRFLLCGILTFFFLRTLRLSPGPSLGGAICFMLSGPVVTWPFWTTNVFLLTPLLLTVLEKLRQDPTARRISLASLVIALTLYGGHPEHIILCNGYGLLFLMFRVLSFKKTTKSKHVALSYSFAIILGMFLAAPVVFPFLSNLTTELWHGHPENVGLLCEQIPNRWVSIILPRFFQRTPLDANWTPAGWWGGYLGVLPILFSLFSIGIRQKRHTNTFFLCFGIFLLAKDYGLAPVNWIGSLPLMNVFRFSFHTLPYTALSFSVAAAFGLRALLANRKPLKKAALCAGLMAITILGNLFCFRNTPTALPAAGLGLTWIFIFICLSLIHQTKALKHRLMTALFVLLIFAELFAYIPRVRPRRFDSFPQTPYLSFLENQPAPARSYGLFWSLFPNTATAYRVDDLGIFMGLLPKRFVTFVNRYVQPDNFVPDLRPTTLRSGPLRGEKEYQDLLNLKYLILPLDRTLPPGYYEQHNLQEVYRNEVCILERKDALPRAFIVSRVIFQPTGKGLTLNLHQVKKQLNRLVVVNAEPEPHILQALSGSPFKNTSPAEIQEYTPNRVVVKVSLAAPGILVLSDSYHPDWVVTVDGERTKLWQADFLLRAVYLDPGDHTVVFSFQPRSFTVGVLVFLLAGLIWMGSFFLPQRNRE